MGLDKEQLRRRMGLEEARKINVFNEYAAVLDGLVGMISRDGKSEADGSLIITPDGELDIEAGMRFFSVDYRKLIRAREGARPPGGTGRGALAYMSTRRKGDKSLGVMGYALRTERADVHEYMDGWCTRIYVPKKRTVMIMSRGVGGEYLTRRRKL